MRIESLGFNAVRILEADKLDPITVLLRDLPGPTHHAGQVIVECYGHAWACYFGSIGERSLVKFLSTDPDYLAGKLARGTEKKTEQAYLLRIAKAVTAACAELAAAPAPTPALELISAERARQVSTEGWTPQHDDEHAGQELSQAAACYALGVPSVGDDGEIVTLWPWDREWWKPSDRTRDLVKAGALIVAEIERLQRAAKREG